MRISIILILFLASAPLFSAQNNDDCPGPDTSTSYEACVLSKETKDLKKKLAVKFDVLLEFAQTSEKGAKQSLVYSQRAWERYLQQACTAQQAVFGGIVSINYIRCENFLVKQRIDYLVSLP